MADFQLLACRIMLAGSKDSVVYRGRHNPLSYPEVLIMQFLHGDDAVTEIEEVGTLDMSNNDLLHHLRLTYPMVAVSECFPGARPNLPVRSDEFLKSRAVLMDAQAKRETPGPGPGPENMTIPKDAPRPRSAASQQRHQSQHQADRVRRQEEEAKKPPAKEDEDAGPFAQ